ncbi:MULTISPECIES: ATP-grasp domain-containing protein [Blautia]|uniref:ATP-grasp domain-containing protein n=1 Tax=Blautia TaxID=572511 RepID=UPI00210AC805|nr:ATP-grasp domain-containing protein [Blautia sp.]MCQ4745313.1 ATP-grasp domain-containing protein [Blautia producta]
MKKIMILGASILQLPAIKKAKEMGLQVIAVDMDAEAVGFKEKDVVCEVISTIDTEKILNTAKSYGVDGIMTLASDMPIRSVAIVAKEMGLVGISEQTALKATNKAFMRQCLKEHGVPVPEFFCVNTREEFLKAIEYFKRTNINCIVKPADNSGSRGVDMLSDLSNMEALGKAFAYSKSYSRSGDILVEEYMEGPEVSVETLSIDGECHVIQITDKITTNAPYFVEMGHSEPSALPDEIKQKIVQTTKSAVKAIGIENGPSHTELKITAEGPKIVELGARLGGDNITTHLVPLSTGVNMVECCIRIAIGDKADIEIKYDKGAAIRYLKADIGEIKEIKGISDAETVKGIQQVSIVKGVGNQSTEIKSSVDRIGFVIAQDITADKAVYDCISAIKKIDIRVG